MSIVDKLSFQWNGYSVGPSTFTERSKLTFDSMRAGLLLAGDTGIQGSSDLFRDATGSRDIPRVR